MVIPAVGYVTTPFDVDVTVAKPILNPLLERIMSPENVFANPTSPRDGPAYIDFASCNLLAVTATATLLLSTPLKRRGSLGANSPLVSYNLKAVESVTAVCANPVAPVYLPLTKVGILISAGSFNVTFVII